MAVYVIVNTVARNPEEYEKYKAQAGPMVEKYGGKVLARGGALEVMEGDWNPARLVLLEFPGRQAFLNFAQSPECAPVAEIRHANPHTGMMLVEGV